MTLNMPVDRTWRSSRLRFIGDVLLAWMPFLIVFVAVPVAIFVPNLVEFNYNLGVVIPFLAVGVFSLVALSGLWLWRPQWRRRCSIGLFYLGVYFLLSDVLTPLRWNILDEETNILEPWDQTFLDFFLAFLLVICWDRIPGKLVKAIGVPMVLVVLASQVATLFLGWQESWEYTKRESSEIRAEPKPDDSASTSKSGNVYHFVFDAYSSHHFIDAVRKLELADAFAGATFFRNTLSNYEATDASVPSFLTGRFYSSGTFADWQREAQDGGLRRDLQKKGYKISVYVPDETRAWMYRAASHVRTSHQLSRSFFRGNDMLRLAQLSLVRLAPSNGRRHTFAYTNHYFGYIVGWLNDVSAPLTFSGYGFYKRLSVPLVRQFLTDEGGREGNGNYVYVHVVLPHSPSVWDSTCSYAGVTDYHQQTLCATRLMGEIIETLKRLGRLDEALVIFQSDHGSHYPEGGVPDAMFAPPPEIRERVHSVVAPYFGAEGYFRKIHPLLVIKPPHADSDDLLISHAPAQLIDIPATVYHLLGLEAPATDGKSVFELEETEPREIHLYPGTFTLPLRPSGSGLSADSDSSLMHITFTQGRGWREYPDIPVRRE